MEWVPDYRILLKAKTSCRMRPPHYPLSYTLLFLAKGPSVRFHRAMHILLIDHGPKQPKLLRPFNPRPWCQGHPLRQEELNGQVPTDADVPLDPSLPFTRAQRQTKRVPLGLDRTFWEASAPFGGSSPNGELSLQLQWQ